MLTNLHIQSVLELGERVTGSRDMRDRAAVLRAVADVPTPLGYIIKESELLKRRAKEVIESLLEERTIDRVTVNREDCYFRTPFAQAAMMQMVANATAAQASGGSVLVMPPPRPTAPLVPAHDLLNSVDPSEEEEVDWASYQGD